jgi:hypothetical protein
VSAFADALPALCLKDQQDTLRRCIIACRYMRLSPACTFWCLAKVAPAHRQNTETCVCEGLLGT